MSRPLTTSPTRRAGYRVLGRGFDFVLHMRPAEWPIMAAHTAVGYLLAVGWSGLWRGDHLAALLLGLVVWVVLLNGGTLAINSAFDRDEGDIGYLASPPPVPHGLGVFALALMVLGQGLAFLLPPLFVKAYAACFVMSLIYSVPPLRLKAVAGFDWVINMWGFGTLTALAGYALTGRPVTTVSALVLLAFCPLFAALYPLTQLYQFEADRQRGDHTLALVLGMRLSLQAAVAAVILSFAIFGAAGFLSSWGSGLGAIGRWLGLLAALVAWLRVLVPWLRDYRIRTPVEHQRAMYDALAAWALTDLVILAAWAT